MCLHGDIVDHARALLPAVTALDVVEAAGAPQTQNVLEALVEVVGEEGVEHGVGTRVGIGQSHHQLERALQRRRGADAAGYRGDIEHVEGQPAQDEHHHPTSPLPPPY